MGWVWLALIGCAALALLWFVPTSRYIGTVAAAALLFGASGYALQQNASLPGHPVRANAQEIEIDPSLVAFRQAVMPASAEDQASLAGADDKVRQGDTAAAAQGLLAAIDRRPTHAVLWTALGGVLAAHDGGHVSPAAQFAFRQAFRLAPRDPGPPFFLGLAYVQSGDLQATKRAWLQTLALAPRDAPYRIAIAERLVMIDRLEAMKAVAR